MTMRELAKEAHVNAVAKGFWDEYLVPENNGERLGLKMNPDQIASKLCLIHSEVSEALEDLREGNMRTWFLNKATGIVWERDENSELPVTPHLKPVGFPSELADIIIRVFDLSCAMGIDIEEEVKLKMAHNATRSRMHGKVI